MEIVSPFGPSAPEQMFAARKEQIQLINRGAKRYKTRGLRSVSRRAVAAPRSHSLRKMADGVRHPALRSSAAYSWTHGSSAIHPYRTSTPDDHAGVGK